MSWQQDIQGACNGLLGKIVQNTEYFNTYGHANPNNPAWYGWSDSWSTWLKAGSMTEGGDNGRQRLTKYDDEMPLKLESNLNLQGERKLSWYHKRNYTLHLVSNPLIGPAHFPPDGFSRGTISTEQTGDHHPGTDTVSNAAWIMCAVNLQGQARYKFSGQFNAYCWDGQYTRQAIAAGGVVILKMHHFSCTVDFVGSAFRNSKRSEPIGYFGGQPVYGKFSGDLACAERVLICRI